jgi:hypothetical protein
VDGEAVTGNKKTPGGEKPVEDLWSNIKGQELANRCIDGLGEAEDDVCSGMDRVRQSKLPFSFLHHAGLLFDSSVILLCEDQ